MNQNRMGALKPWRGMPSRRHLLRGLAGAGIGWGATRLPDRAAAKKGKPKPKSRKGLCAKDGSKCRRPGKQCKKKYCLNAPFTITASWIQTADHDTYLFVPPQDAATGPSPHIKHRCNPDTSTCEEDYPFACVDGDEQVAGDEVTTIHQLLPGKYEYWLEIDRPNLAGEPTVTLKAKSGRVVRRWISPAAPGGAREGWHVFDIDGRDGRVTSIDAVHDDDPPTVYFPSTNVCPTIE